MRLEVCTDYCLSPDSFVVYAITYVSIDGEGVYFFDYSCRYLMNDLELEVFRT